MLPTVDFTIITSNSCPRDVIISAEQRLLLSRLHCVKKSYVLADEKPRRRRRTKIDISVREIGDVC
jgi:hypothetical protein